MEDQKYTLKLRLKLFYVWITSCIFYGHFIDIEYNKNMVGEINKCIHCHKDVYYSISKKKVIREEIPSPNPEPYDD